MSDRENSQDPNVTTDNNGIAERIITAEDMKQYKSAMDNVRSYVSGDKEWSSSSHQFTKEPFETKKTKF